MILQLISRVAVFASIAYGQTCQPSAIDSLVGEVKQILTNFSSEATRSQAFRHLLEKVEECGLSEPWSEEFGDLLSLAGADKRFTESVQVKALKAPVTCPDKGPLTWGALYTLSVVQPEHAIRTIQKCGIAMELPRDFGELLRLAGIDKSVIAAVEFVAPDMRSRRNAIDGQLYVLVPGGYFKEQRIKSFWMGETEVTQGAYAKVAGTNPPKGEKADLPAQVEPAAAEAFCKKIGGRLPTALEFSYAQRARDMSPTPADLDRLAWHRWNSGGRERPRDSANNPRYRSYLPSLQPVARKLPNKFGLFDILGNSQELVTERSNLLCSPECTYDSSCTGYNDAFTTALQYPIHGFRCAMDLEE